MKRQSTRKISILMLLLMFVVGFMPGQKVMATEPIIGQGPVVLYELYGGGGNNNAVFKSDFIVLKNISEDPVDLTGWAVQYASGTGTFNTHVVLAGELGPGKYYLIEAAAGNNKELPAIPPADLVSTIAMGAVSFKVALTRDNVGIKLSTMDAETIKNYPNIVDYVGVGSASAFLGEKAAPAASNETSVIRKDITGDNSKDFETHTPTLDYYEKQIGILTIEEARAAAIEEEVTTKGVVTFISGRDVVIQDATAGIHLFLAAADAELKLGMEITVTGERTAFRGLEQIKPTTVLKGELVDLPAPKKVTMEDLQDVAKMDAMESQRILIEEVTLGAINTGGNTSITKDGKSINIFRIPALTGILEGDVVNVVAVLSQHNTHQLRVADAGDIVSASDENIITIEEARNAEAGTEVIVRGLVTFKDDNNVVVQDQTAAINNYFDVMTTASIDLGQEMTITGTRGVYRNLEQIKVTDYRKGDVKPLPTPKTVTMEEITAPDFAESIESQRIALKGVTLGKINTSGNTKISKDGKEINVYKMPALEGIVEGDVVDLVAIMSQFNTTYQLRVASAMDVTMHKEIYDPISDEMLGDAKSLKDVYAMAAGADVVTIGQVAYTFGGNSIFLQDVIHGEIVGLQLYDFTRFDSYDVGDLVQVTGKVGVYGGVHQVSDITDLKILGQAEPFAPREMTIQEILDGGDTLLSQFVKINEVELGKYVDNGATPIKDATGTMNIFRAPAYPVGVQEGDVVNLYAGVSKFNATRQLRVGSSYDYEIFNDTDGPMITLPTFLPAKAGQDYSFAIDVVDNVGVESVTMAYTLNGKTSDVLDMERNTTTGKYQGLISGDKLFGATEMKILFTAKDVNDNVSTTEVTIAVEDQPQILAVTPRANASTEEDKTPLITVEFENAGENPVVLLSLNGEEAVPMTVAGNTASYQVTEAMEDGKVAAVITIERKDGVKSTPFEWTFYIGEPQFNFYFGQLHSHTNYSDGVGTPDQALEYAKNAEQIDFLAITDHSNYFDSTAVLGSFDDPDSGLRSDKDPSMSKWAYYKSYFDKHATEDFLPIYGFEMTWSGQYGHINTFNSNGFVSRNNPVLNARGGAGLKAYYELLKEQEGTFSMFNHPGPTFGTFEDFGHYDKLVDEKINLIEVGNGEGPVRGSGYWPSYQYFTQALDKGWHLAPANGQDNHKGRWGDSNTTRTVAVTDSLTKESIFGAFANMSVYSTEDNNFEIFYTLNNQPMGSTIKDEVDKVDILVDFNDPDSTDIIGKVSVIVNGGITAHAEYINSNTGKLEVTLPNDYTYYYIRVDQADGDIAVTAPVWTGEVTQVGLNDFTKNTAMDVLGEETILTSHLYNGETSDFFMTKIEYLVDGEVLETQTANLPVIAKGTEKAVDYVYVPQKIGVQTVTVNMEGTLDGVTMAFTKSITLSVYDNKSVVEILVDAAHDNFYVSGDYANNDTYFTTVAGQKGARVRRVNDTITKESLEGVSLLMLTVPYSGFGKVPKIYTDAEIEAIKEYAENGGNIILSSKSDRGNPSVEEGKASVISNKLLEAIGANARIADGIVVDNVRKSNEAYRIQFVDEANFNEDSKFGQGILTRTTKTFNAYNSAPVILNGATPIIMGNDTTWGASYTKNFTGSAYVPDYAKDEVVAAMGDVTLVAEEILPGGGFLITSGVTFFSNFEVTVEMLIEESVRNANFMILNNAIDEIIPISTIEDVQKANEGIQFRIQGRLTSNTSGFDRSTAFFDSAYIQDETGGINIFPIDGNYEEGTMLDIIGTTSSYQGEHQLNIFSMKVMDEPVLKVAPTKMTTKEVPDHLGLLVEVEGIVLEVIRKEGVVESIMVEDRSGEAIRVFIDGYIGTAVEMPVIVEGDFIQAIGLSSIDPEGNRIRVRDRAEITMVQKATDKTALTNAMKEAEEIDLEDMTEETSKILEAALVTGKLIVEDMYARQAEVDEATKNILDAMDQLVAKEPGTEEPGEEEPGEEEPGTEEPGTEEPGEETLKNDTEKILDALEGTPEKGTLIIDARDAKKVDKAVFEALKGQDKTIVFETDNAIWTFYGKDIKDAKDIDLTVTMAPIADSTSKNKNAIKNAVKNEDVLIISFSDNGMLPGKAVVRVKLDEEWLKGKDKNNLHVYYYNTSTEKVEVIAKKLKVDAEGYVEFTITKNSDYFIADKDLQETGVLPKTGSENAMNTILPLSMILVLGGVSLLLFEKKRLVKKA